MGVRWRFSIPLRTQGLSRASLSRLCTGGAESDWPGVAFPGRAVGGVLYERACVGVLLSPRRREELAGDSDGMTWEATMNERMLLRAVLAYLKRQSGSRLRLRSREDAG